MKLITVGTGSSGNCYLLQRENDHFIALDCGCPWKRVMVTSNFRPADIDFAIVTHSHSDHAKYVRDFTSNGISVLKSENVIPKKIYKKGASAVIPFEVPHDTLCYGYLLNVDGRRVVYMTDFGYCKYTFKTWNVDTWLIACNHIDAPDSDEAKYAHVVMGHSSLSTVKEILEINKNDAMKNVILCHYSEIADTDRMIQEVKEVVGDGVNVYLAKKGQVINL